MCYVVVTTEGKQSLTDLSDLNELQQTPITDDDFMIIMKHLQTDSVIQGD